MGRTRCIARGIEGQALNHMIDALDSVTLKQGEKVVGVYRSHWIAGISGWFIGFALVVTPFFFMAKLFAYRTPGVAVFLVLILLGLTKLGQTYVEWNGSAFVVTSYRVVDVVREGFFGCTVSGTTYDRVQDVSYVVPNAWAALLRCGTVTVQAISGTLSLQIDFVRDPQKVHHAVTTAAAAASGPSAASHEEKVEAILDAADELDHQETEALLLALRQRAKDKKAEPEAKRPEQDLSWYRDQEKDAE